MVQADRLPDKPAVIDDRPDGTTLIWSYAELNRQANRLAHVFRELGVNPGERFIWCGPNSPAMVAVGHARAKVGATAVPLNYRLTAEETAYIVEDSDAVLIYADTEQAETFARIRLRMTRVRHVVIHGGSVPEGMLDGDALVAQASAVEPPPAPADHPASMLYTSGTTGRPKGAVRQPLDPAAIVPLLRHIGFQEDDVHLTTGPLYHSGPGGFLQIAHLFGNTAVVQRKFDPEDWLRLVQKYRVTTTFSAPTPIRMVCNLPRAVKARYDRSSMKRMIANAAPWSFALKEQYLGDFQRIRSGKSTARQSWASTRCWRRKTSAANQAHAARRRRAWRSSSSTSPAAQSPSRTRRARCSCAARTPSSTTTRPRRSPRRAAGAISSRWATSPIATPRASTTSAIARAT